MIIQMCISSELSIPLCCIAFLILLHILLVFSQMWLFICFIYILSPTLFLVLSSPYIPFHIIFLFVSVLTLLVCVSLPPSCALSHCLIFITAALT